MVSLLMVNLDNLQFGAVSCNDVNVDEIQKGERKSG